MKKWLWVLLLCVPLLQAQTSTTSLIGKEDLKYWDGVTDTFQRRTSSGNQITLSKFGNEVDVLAVYGSGTSRTSATLNAAIGQIGTSRNATLVLSPGTWAITANVTIPSNMSIEAPAGVAFSISSGITLTINGGFIAGDYSIFSGSGTADLSSALISECRTEWWGVDGTADDIQINAALDSCGKIPVALLARTYTLADSGTIYMADSQVLRGQGKANTVLDVSAWTTAGEYVIETDVNTVTHQNRLQIRDLKILGPSTTAINGIGLLRTHRSWVDNVFIDEIGGIAIQVDGLTSGAQSEAHYNQITRCEFAGTHTHGIQILGNSTTASNRGWYAFNRDNGASTYAYQVGSTSSGRCNTNTFISCHAENASGGAWYVAYTRNAFLNCATESITGNILTTPTTAGRNLWLGGSNDALGGNADPQLFFLDMQSDAATAFQSRIFAYEYNASSDSAQTGADITFNENTPDADTITSPATGLEDMDNRLVILGSASNDGTYYSISSDATTITLDDGEDLVAEAAGASVRIEPRAEVMKLFYGKVEAPTTTYRVHIDRPGNLIFRGKDDDADVLEIGTDDSVRFNRSQIQRGDERIGVTDVVSFRAIIETTAAAYVDARDQPLTDTNAYLFKLYAIANQSDGSDRAAYGKGALCYREGGGAVVQSSFDLFADQESDAAWAGCRFVADGNSIDAECGGAAGETIEWNVIVEYQTIPKAGY